MLIQGLVYGGGLVALPILLTRWVSRRFPDFCQGERRFRILILSLGLSLLAIRSFVGDRFLHAPLGLVFDRTCLIQLAVGWFVGFAVLFIWIWGFIRISSPDARFKETINLSHPLSEWGIALCMGLIEEYAFRGAWGSYAGQIWANGIYVFFCAAGIRLANPHFFWRQRTPVMPLILFSLSLFLFGLSLSWVYWISGSLAGSIGIHSGVYYAFCRWPRVDRGLSTRSWGYWWGEESPALGVFPVLLYCGIASVCAFFFHL